MDLDDLDFLSDYLKNRDKIILSDAENEDDDTNLEKPSSRKRAAPVEIKIEDDESNVSTKKKIKTIIQRLQFMYRICIICRFVMNKIQMK